jgi:hypothetical protein
MGDDTLVKVSGQGRVDLDNECFRDVLYVPKLSINLLSIYRITHSVKGKQVEFTPDLVVISEMLDGSKVVVGEVDHHSRLYTFSHFVPKSDFVMLLTHVNEESRLWHGRFGHLNFRYLQQLNKQGMVNGLPNIKFIDGVCQGCILGKHPEEKFEKGKAWRESSPLLLVHNNVMGLFPYPSLSKAKYVLTFIDDWSRYTWVYFLKFKSKFFERLLIFQVTFRKSTREKDKDPLY